ncbi:hypothetical protein [Aeromicrobium sp. CF3.5]|uniref:hypothetical protein n=1 Tax=Aeromicrobium sp. CF3.5 TaxID=3373078 RepID=UPI003EE6DF8D
MRVTGDAALTTAADGVGAASTVLGGLLAVAPQAGGRWLGLADTSVAERRALGTADLGLGITIIAARSSRRRWCAVSARSLLHLVFARTYLRTGRRDHAAAMCALFVVDAGIAMGLREESREARRPRSTSKRTPLRFGTNQRGSQIRTLAERYARHTLGDRGANCAPTIPDNEPAIGRRRG